MKGGEITMEGYYKKQRKKSKRPVNRKLRLNCPVHGDLIGFSEDFKIVIYEAFNYEKRKVELKCFQCLKEEYNMKKSEERKELEKVDKERHKKYGRNAKICSFISGTLFFIAFYLGVYLLFLRGWATALPAAFAIGGIGYYIWRVSEKLDRKKVEAHPYPNLPILIDPMREAASQKEIVKKWRIEQAKIKRESIDFSLSDIDKMTGIQFEFFVQNLLKNTGYEDVKLTKASGDKGVDIIAYKNSKKIAIQCKRYDAKLTNNAIQQVFSGQHIYECDEAYVITNSHFTEQAIDDARKLRVRLIDRGSLYELMQKANQLEEQLY